MCHNPHRSSPNANAGAKLRADEWMGTDCMTIGQKIAWRFHGAILLLCIVLALCAVAGAPPPGKLAPVEGADSQSTHPATTNRLPPARDGKAIRRDTGMNRGLRDSSPPAGGRRVLQKIDPVAGQYPIVRAERRADRLSNLRFTHLTTEDGLSQNRIYTILQDRTGFMWIGTRDGLNRYDGNTFVVYKHDPNNPETLSANFIRDLIEDKHGDLWVATGSGGLNRFDPITERFTRYRHDPDNPNSISSDTVENIAQDSHGYLWFATSDHGLDKFDPATGTFAHYANDSDGRSFGPIHNVLVDRRGDIWFVGERGLFHLNPQTGQITRPSATAGLFLGYVQEDEDGNLWMSTYSPSELVKYDRQAERLTRYPLRAGVVGLDASNLLADGRDGFWVPSSQGLYYFDRHTKRFTRLLRHDETDPNGLNDNSVVSVYRDRAGLLWLGTEDGGLNILNLQEQQFGFYRHRPSDPNSLSSGRVTAVYQDADGILWVGFFPRALDKLDRKTGRITHYRPDPKIHNALSKGSDLNSMYKDAHGYLWVGGWGGGLDRYYEPTGQFKHYGHNSSDPGSLISDNVICTYGDRSGQLWVGQRGGLSRFDSTTERFSHYRPDPDHASSLENSVGAIYQDRSGTLWVGTWAGVLSRFDDSTKTFVKYSPRRDPQSGNAGEIDTLYQDRAGTLWVGAADGLYRYNRHSETFTRYTETNGLPSSSIEGLLEDDHGKLWISTRAGISRFDPQTEAFRNYDASDGLQGNEFSDGSVAQAQNGEMFFGGSNGITTLFPENIRDNPYVPPVVVVSFKIFNKPVPIGAKSVLKKSISYIDRLTLSYRDNVFSLEFAALSYANSKKNRYRYKLDGLEPGWNEVGSQQRLATYTNLDPGKYVFRVQGSNGDGVWNDAGVSLPIVILPPWWGTNLFRTFCAATVLALLWAAYQLRVRHLARQLNTRLEERVSERTRIARDLHDTLLQSFQGLLPRFQAAIYKLPESAVPAREILEAAIDQASQAITEGRDAVQGLRASTVQKNDLAIAIRGVAAEMASGDSNPSSPAFQVAVQGKPRNLHPILRDEIYRIAAEALRNAFRHAQAGQIEVELGYGERDFTLHIRDDGRGINREVLSSDGREGHYGLHGMRERAKLVGGKLTIWSEVDSGTEVELRIPASRAYTKSVRRFWFFEKLSKKDADVKEKIES